MKTEKDIQIELLKEIDSICTQNNLKYSLIGTNGINAFVNHTIKNGPISVSIAMTAGDIGRFCEIVENTNDGSRYTEKIVSESKTNPWHVNYGNENTTYFHIFSLDKKAHHGINIEIYPIRGFTLLNKKPDQVSDKKDTNSSKNSIFGSLKRIFSSKEHKEDKELKKESEVKAKKDSLKDKTYIDKWEDIQEYSTVKIVNTKIKANALNGLERYAVDDTELYLPKDASKFFTEIFGRTFKNRKIKPTVVGPRYIMNTERPYNEVIEESKDLIDEAKSMNEEISLESSKANDDRKSLNKLWDLILMTNKQIEYTKYFDENVDNLLTLDLDDEKQFNEVYKELKPVISTLNKYSKMGMTFSINPETDDLIEKVLILKGNKKLVNKLNQLKEKEYFVE